MNDMSDEEYAKKHAELHRSMQAIPTLQQDSMKASLLHKWKNSTFIFEGRTNYGYDGYVWFVPEEKLPRAKKLLCETLGITKQQLDELFYKPDGIRFIGKGYAVVKLDIQSEFIKTYKNGVIRIGWSE